MRKGVNAVCGGRMSDNMARKSVYDMKFSKIYPLLVQKAEKKGRTKAEVDEVITWLTGYTQFEGLDVTYGEFFENAPAINPNAALIKGTVCGVRVEEVADPLMREIRYLDKLVDELARGKPMEKVLRKQEVK